MHYVHVGQSCTVFYLKNNRLVDCFNCFLVKSIDIRTGWRLFDTSIADQMRTSDGTPLLLAVLWQVHFSSSHECSFHFWYLSLFHSTMFSRFLFIFLSMLDSSSRRFRSVHTFRCTPQFCYFFRWPSRKWREFFVEQRFVFKENHFLLDLECLSSISVNSIKYRRKREAADENYQLISSMW